MFLPLFSDCFLGSISSPRSPRSQTHSITLARGKALQNGNCSWACCAPSESAQNLGSCIVRAFLSIKQFYHSWEQWTLGRKKKLTHLRGMNCLKDGAIIVSLFCCFPFWEGLPWPVLLAPQNSTLLHAVLFLGKWFRKPKEGLTYLHLLLGQEIKS